MRGISVYQVIRGSQNGNVGIQIEKKLTPDDYALLIPYIDKLRNKAGSVSVLCDMSHCECQTTAGLWQELVNRLQLLCDVPRVAVVGSTPSETESSTTQSPTLSNTTVRYFTATQLDQAWDWLEEFKT